MTVRKSVTVRDVERAYGRVKVLLPNVGELRRDDFFKTWFIGKMQIGATARDAERYLAGLQNGLMYGAMSIGVGRRAS